MSRSRIGTAFMSGAAMLAGCTSVPTVHERARLKGSSPVMCMAEDGRWIDETSIVDPGTRQSLTYCPAPARYIYLPACKAGQTAPQETPELLRARRKAARDQSLYTDTFNGKAYCHPSPSVAPLSSG